MTTTARPSHEFQCRIATPPNTLRPFLCRLWLPGEIDDEGALEFSLPREAHDLLLAWPELDLEGWREDSDGKHVETFRMPAVHTGGFVARHIDAATVALDVKTAPGRIEITRARDTDERASCTFFLTAVDLLYPQQTLVDSYTGETERHGAKECISVRSGEYTLTFDAHFTHKRHDENTDTRTKHLVATTQLSAKLDAATVESLLLPKLDLVLRLSSLAARRRSVCYRWQGWSSEHIINVFRHDVSKPHNKPLADSRDDEPLIRRRSLKEFLQVSMDKLATLPDPSLLEAALARMPPKFPTTVEAEFLRLFAALESILLWYRKPRNLDFILPPTAWAKARPTLRTALKGWAEEQPALASEATRRGWLYRKIGELNRIPIAVAFDAFVAHYSVQLDDLWPVFGRSLVPLSSIRNRIIHGAESRRDELTSYMVALENLRWTIERMLLALLAWPIAASTVSPSHLSALYAYHWKDHERKFTRDDA